MGKLLEARTAYAKGFNKESSTLDELIEYYNESNPDVVSIQMRNYCEKKGKDKVWKFKGSIFLTFKTEEAAKTFGEGGEVQGWGLAEEVPEGLLGIEEEGDG